MTVAAEAPIATGGAVCALSGDLFPGRAIGTRPMAISVAVMNLGTCLFGAIPSCHGSGGLAGQHRFGARTGGSMVVLGLFKMALGILFGSAVGVVLAAFPSSLLGVLLAFAGLELGLAAREESGRDGFFVVAAGSTTPKICALRIVAALIRRKLALTSAYAVRDLNSHIPFYTLIA